MNNTPQPNYELLKDAYAIIGGIPGRQFNLETIVDTKGDSLSCGTICCAAGWLGLHPQFNELGLTTDTNRLGSNCVLKMKGVDDYEWYDEKLAHLFNIPANDAKNLFSPRGISDLDDGINIDNLSHKQLFLRRVKVYLKQKGQL